MFNDHDLPLYKNITRRYMLAVLIILILSSGAWYTLRSALLDSESTAYIVNISGRQRMLSQHIALDAHRLDPVLELTKEQQSEVIKRMQQHIRDMDSANRQLSSGKLNNGDVVDLSHEVRDMYFSEMNLSQRVSDYLVLAQAILNTKSTAEYAAKMEQIDLISEPLLTDLNKIVNQYQLEGEQRLMIISRIETAVWLLTVVALVLEVIFIFRPMTYEVIKSREAEEKTLENLQNLVELRTLKLETANRKLQEMATLDPLTNINNRLTLERDIEEIIQGFRKHNIDFAVGMLDIDWFKNINDTYGHLAGDYVLQEVAKLFSDFIRDNDKVYRSGGEEFVILLNRIGLSEAEQRMETLRNKVKEFAFNHHGAQFHISISIGLYHSSLFSVNEVHGVLKAADEALYLSKESGRNRITLATS